MGNADIIASINNAVGAHGKWKFNLKMAISNGKSDYKVENVEKDNLCEFGKWLYSDQIDSDTKQGKPYEVITRLHKEFHICASKVLELALSGQSNKASALLESEFTQSSDKLVRALNKWKGELS